MHLYGDEFTSLDTQLSFGTQAMQSDDYTGVVHRLFQVSLALIFGFTITEFLQSTLIFMPFHPNFHLSILMLLAAALLIKFLMLGFEVYTWFSEGPKRLIEYSSLTRTACYLIWMMEIYPLLFIAIHIGSFDALGAAYPKAMVEATLSVFVLLALFNVPMFIELLLTFQLKRLLNFIRDRFFRFAILCGIIIGLIWVRRSIPELDRNTAELWVSISIAVSVLVYYSHWMRGYIRRNLPATASAHG